MRERLLVESRLNLILKLTKSLSIRSRFTLNSIQPTCSTALIQIEVAGRFATVGGGGGGGDHPTDRDNFFAVRWQHSSVAILTCTVPSVSVINLCQSISK